MLHVLSGIGALLGAGLGVVPAFFLAARTGLGEIGFCLGTMALSTARAFLGLTVARAIFRQTRRGGIEWIIPIVLGVCCGFLGFVWFDHEMNRFVDMMGQFGH